MIWTALAGEALASDTTFFRFCTPLANTLILSGTTWVAPAYHRTCFRCCETIHAHSCSVVVVPASMCNTGSFVYDIHVTSSLWLEVLMVVVVPMVVAMIVPMLFREPTVRFV